MTFLLTEVLVGMTARRRHPDMRAISVHCVGRDQLSEDRIFIDLPRFQGQRGVDILARFRDYSRTWERYKVPSP